MAAALPFIDEHAVDVAAGAEESWEALVRTVGAAFGGPRAELFARIVGCTERRAGGPPAARGSTLVGFRVADARPPRALDLEGAHLFSRYALTFHVDRLASDRSRLRATSRAEFPGPHGRVYRALVLGSGAHVVLVRRLLLRVKRGAESRS